MQGQEDVGGEDGRDVVVPALPGVAVVAVQPETGLDLAIVVFDALVTHRLYRCCDYREALLR